MAIDTSPSHCSFDLHPILHSKYYGSIPSVSVHVADIGPSLNISRIVKELNKQLKDEHIKHLKRVSKRSDKDLPRIIVGKVDEITASHLEMCRELGLVNFEVVDVPATQPWTRSQYNECKERWPVNFHEEKFTRKCLDGSRFDLKELEQIKLFLRRILLMKLDLKKDIALITDGVDILATGVCDSLSNPLKHCCVNAIAQIADEQVKTQSGNAAVTEKPYLCTDFDAFVTQEPCLMCSMALLHSRIKRLFFIESNTSAEKGCPMDGSFTRMKLHVNSQLNHRFEVWKAKEQMQKESAPD